MNVLVQELLTMIGPPEHTDDPKGYLSGLAKLTDHFGPTTLSKAANHLVRRAGRKWPTPNDIVEACVEAQESIAAAEAAKPQRREKPKTPWEVHAELAHAWAVDFCKHTMLGKQAFDEGWGRPLFLLAKSLAREAYRTNTALDRTSFSVSVEWLRYYRGSADLDVHLDDLAEQNRRAGKTLRGHAAPKSYRWIDRVALLGDELGEAIADNRKTYGARDVKQLVCGLFQTPLPAALPEDEFEREQRERSASPPPKPPAPPQPFRTDRTAWEARFGKPTGEAA